MNGRGPRQRRGRDRAFRPVVLELYSSSFFEMVLPSLFPDATTRNRPHSMIWQPKRPVKWPELRFSRTLRHEIGHTAYSGSPSVQSIVFFVCCLHILLHIYCICIYFARFEAKIYKKWYNGRNNLVILHRFDMHNQQTLYKKL